MCQHIIINSQCVNIINSQCVRKERWPSVVRNQLVNSWMPCDLFMKTDNVPLARWNVNGELVSQLNNLHQRYGTGDMDLCGTWENILDIVLWYRVAGIRLYSTLYNTGAEINETGYGKPGLLWPKVKVKKHKQNV